MTETYPLAGIENALASFTMLPDIDAVVIIFELMALDDVNIDTSAI